jgi:gag-polyprotein putative aspartyl protease
MKPLRTRPSPGSILFVVVLRTVGLVCAVAGLQAANPQHTLPTRIISGFRVELPVRVNGSGPFRCVLDSGAAQFSLDAALGERLGFRAMATGRSYGEGPGVVPDQRLLHASLEVGDLQIRDRMVILHPMEDDCLFGTDLLDQFVVEIDYLAPAIRLYAAKGYRPADGATAVPLTLDRYRRPMIAGRLLLQSGDAVTARLLLDTGIPDYALSLGKAFIDGQGILKRVPRVIQPPFHGQATGGAVDLMATRIRRLSVGAVGVDDPVVLLFRSASGAGGQPPDGLVGSGFLHRFLVAIDVPHRRLYLTPTRAYRDREPSWSWAEGLPRVR